MMGTETVTTLVSYVGILDNLLTHYRHDNILDNARAASGPPVDQHQPLAPIPILTSPSNDNVSQ